MIAFLTMFRFFDTLSFTLERLNQHRVLVLWVLVGLSVATTLALSLSLYVDSVYSELLESRLDDPPYAFRYRYLGAWNGNIGEVDVTHASAAIQTHLVDALGMPVERDARFVRGGTWSVRLEQEAATALSLGTFSLGTLEGADDQIMIVSGSWPPDATATDTADTDAAANGSAANDSVVNTAATGGSATSAAAAPADTALPVLAPETVLYDMGLQVGDVLTAQRTGGGQVTLQIVALWSPVNADDPAWIFTPKFFDNVFLLQPDDLASTLSGLENPIDEVAWYMVFDGSDIRTADVSGLLDRIVSGQRTVDAVLPGIREDLSPVAGLKAFDEEVESLTQQLFIIIAPVGGLVLYFVSLVAGLLVSRQQPEDVKLRSRGMSRRGVLAIHVLMWLLLVGVGLTVGLTASPAVVRLVGRTSSFLSFDDSSSVVSIVFTPQAIMLGAVTGLIAASSGLFMAWRTTQQNINTYRRASARAAPAWWQRAYLDLMMLVPAGYVLYTLWQQGGLTTDAETPFSDPLAFVGPTLFALGLSLLFLRLWPMLLTLWARFLSVTNNITVLMALRELTRASGRYRGALLMMAFTLSLTGFTASMASTLDLSLIDTINYRTGSDLVVVTAVDAQTESDSDDSGSTTLTVTGYNVPPTSDLLDIEGVAAASRVGRHTARLVIGSQRLEGTALGVDRASMAAVTRFREDYAAEPLADMLNKLAGQRTGILVDSQTAADYNLVPNQTVTLQLLALDTWWEARVPIIGFLDYFPTLDPSDGFFLVGNLDPLHEMAGTVLPFDVWLGLYPDADVEAVQQAVIDSEFPVLRWEEPEAELRAARAEPARRGVLGFLSIGFVASITLTLIAAIIQSTASFRAQVMQLGTLRAMGLSGRAVGFYIMFLQGLAALSGIASGTSIGVATTLLFLPLLDFSSGLPPYLVRVAWGEITLVYSVFAGVLFTVTLLTTLLLSRQQMATVIRLGDV